MISLPFIWKWNTCQQTIVHRVNADLYTAQKEQRLERLQTNDLRRFHGESISSMSRWITGELTGHQVTRIKAHSEECEVQDGHKKEEVEKAHKGWVFSQTALCGKEGLDHKQHVSLFWTAVLLLIKWDERTPAESTKFPAVTFCVTQGALTGH